MESIADIKSMLIHLINQITDPYSTRKELAEYTKLIVCSVDNLMRSDDEQRRKNN
jgi:hypothetical protein